MSLTMTHREDVATGHYTWVEQWALQGACIEAEPDALFVRGAAQQQAKQVCMSCPVIAECLADALLKRRPGVTSWRALFEADRLRQERPAS